MAIVGRNVNSTNPISHGEMNSSPQSASLRSRGLSFLGRGSEKTVIPAFPAGLLQQLGGLVEIELPMGIGRLKLLGGIEDIAGELGGSTIELLGDGTPIDSHRIGLPHSEIGKKGMGHLHAAALALDLRSGVRAIDLNVLEHYARSDMKRALAPLLR